jgi:UTP--glucose-1-phosphate uridylyltransferase
MATAHASLPIVIPSAGLGTRFLPLSRVMPKELLLLGEWPLIHHALLEVRRAGFGEVIVVISPAKRAIRAYFEGDGALEHLLESRGEYRALQRLRAAGDSIRGLRVRFIEKETQGPGEAVLLAHRLAGNETLGVLLPDDVVPSRHQWDELLKVWSMTGAPSLTVRAFPQHDSTRYRVAVCSPERVGLRVTRLVEKPVPGTVASPYRIFGRYIVTASVLASLEPRLRRAHSEVQLTDGYAGCLERGSAVYAAEFNDETFDCGTPDSYADAVMRYAVWTSSHGTEPAPLRPRSW